MKTKIILGEYDFKELKKRILKNKETISINFFNGLDIYSFTKISEFRECLENKHIKNINNIDGISTAIPLSVKNFRKIKRLQGPTFTDKFLKDKELNKKKKHFFIGVERGNLDKVIGKYPNLKKENISGYNLPYVSGLFFPEKEIKKLIKIINKHKPDYLWVGMGAPKQQILTNQIYDKINVKNIFNVGVAMEFIKGSRKRAPKIFQGLGFEWLYRLFEDFKLTSGRLFKSLTGSILSLFIIKLEDKKHDKTDNSKKKIFFIGRFPPPIYGTSLMNYKYANSKLLRRKFEISTLRMNSAKEISSKEKINFRKVYLGLSRIPKIISGLLKNPDLVYLDVTPKGVAFYRDSIYLFLTKLFRKKVLVGFHSKGLKKETKNNLKEFYYKRVFKKTNAVILSQILYEDINNLFRKEDVYFNANGIDDVLGNKEFEKILKKKKGRKKKRLIFLSNMLESKGPLDALKICNLLQRDKINFECFFVGDWEEEKFKKKWFEYRKKNKLEKRCIFLGPKYGKEKTDILKESDFLIFPTKYPLECYPLVILEAFMMGIPAYSYDNGAIREIIGKNFLGHYSGLGEYEILYKKLKENIKKPQRNREIRRYFKNNFMFGMAEKRLRKIFDEVLVR